MTTKLYSFEVLHDDLQNHSAQYPLWTMAARDNVATNSSTQAFSVTAKCNDPDDSELD